MTHGSRLTKLTIHFFREKYNLAPPTTIDSPDGTPNYQSLDSGFPNYQLLVFWPHPSVCTVILDGNTTCARHVTLKDKKFANALNFNLKITRLPFLRKTRVLVA
jgi:hypothetical protein